MSRNTFSWYPDAETDRSIEPAVLVTKFGDGYEARTASGINTMRAKWSLKFTRDMTEAASILAFLANEGGLTAFNWETPLHETLVVVCRSWKSSRDRGTTTITCDFEQVFEA